MNAPTQSRLTNTAETVLERRYYLKDEDDNVKEDWNALCIRVADAISSVEMNLWKRDECYALFHSMIYNLDFLPNSPCLMNAGTDIGQLSACFVLPVEDSMDGIFTSIKNGALIHKSGGGTGYSFNRLRAKNSQVKSTQGIASGPLSFMSVFDSATETIKQGGKRRGANMAVLGVNHPDILDFIDAKEDTTKFTNFNFSVAITDEFMTDVIAGDGQEVEIFNRIVDRAWRTGEPGVLFIDRANEANPTPHLGKFEATNPCGEQWLLPYESCNLGSINLGNFVLDSSHVAPENKHKTIDWKRLDAVTRLAVRFLDNVIDCNKFPIPEIKEATLKTRKIGLGIMGLHDMLIQLGIPYGSEEGRATAARVMSFINEIAHEASTDLAQEKGAFPAYDRASCGFAARRNAAITSIQPTGTVSMIADCASGCEPYFSTVMVKHVMDGDKLLMVNKHFEEVAIREGFYSVELMEEVAQTGSVIGVKGVPKKWQYIFATAQDISPMDHILMQAVLQKHVDASISKTINLPANATKEDVAGAYMLGWKEGCKGLTVYRDGSRDNQVLNAGTKEQKTEAPTQEQVWYDKHATYEVAPPYKMILPDVLRSHRFKLKDKDGESIYVIVCFTDDMQPVEVFAKFPYDNRIEQQERSTMWSTTCRLVSQSLRYGIPVEEVIKQLDRSSGSMFDLPAQLSKLFKGFIQETRAEGFSSPCPDCDGQLVYEEGCECCKNCGYSKCS